MVIYTLKEGGKMMKSLETLEKNFKEAKDRYDIAKAKHEKGISGHFTKWVQSSYKRALTALTKAKDKKEADTNKNDKVEEFLANWAKNARDYYNTYCRGTMSDKEIEKTVENEVIRKRTNFYLKVTGRTGKIIDTDLRIGKDGNLNGSVTGEKEFVTVTTIYAGGHNIQCLHYRVLIK